MTSERKQSLSSEVRMWSFFVVASALNIFLVGRFDSWRQGRTGHVSDGTIQLIDAAGVLLLGLTLLGLRIRSPKNVGIASMLVCALLPGVLLLVCELVL